MRNESRRVWSLQVEEGGIVQEVLRKQAGFSKKEISRAKFLPDGIRKNGKVPVEHTPGGDFFLRRPPDRHKGDRHLCGDLEPGWSVCLDL